LFQVLANRRWRLGNTAARFLFELESPISQMADPNPQRPRYLGLGLLAQSRWRTASSLNSRLYLVYGLRGMEHPSKSKYCSFRCVHQTWVGSGAAVPVTRSNTAIDYLWHRGNGGGIAESRRCRQAAWTGSLS
jgi:hypothetical protein